MYVTKMKYIDSPKIMLHLNVNFNNFIITIL